MFDAFACLLYPKVCWHNWNKPVKGIIATACMVYSIIILKLAKLDIHYTMQILVLLDRQCSYLSIKCYQSCQVQCKLSNGKQRPNQFSDSQLTVSNTVSIYSNKTVK